MFKITFNICTEAVRSSNLDIAQMLIEAGCNINLSDRLSHAPIHEAIRQGKLFLEFKLFFYDFFPNVKRGDLKIHRVHQWAHL